MQLYVANSSPPPWIKRSPEMAEEEIYALSSWNDDYYFHHSDIMTAFNIADGLQAAGCNVTVLWGGLPAVVHGVKHESYLHARPKKNDVFIACGPAFGHALRTLPAFEPLRLAEERWWYPYGYAGGQQGGFWKHIFVEGYTLIEQTRLATPDASIHWLMPGVVHDVDLTKPSPYPEEQKAIFFGGRMMMHSSDVHNNQLGFIRELIDKLPEAYHIYICSGSVQLPEGDGRLCYDGVRDIAKGKIVHIPLPGREPAETWVEVEPNSIVVKHDDAVEMFNSVLNHPRIHFLGVKSHGDYWEWYRHAHATLDFGLNLLPRAPNCKIMDPLRAGCPVVADGHSPSHYLLHKYENAGRVVPYRDSTAMAQVLIDLPPYDAAIRDRLANEVVTYESWHVRALNMLHMTGRR